MTRKIHPTAVISPGAELGEDVEVGPYAVIGPDVVLGARCRIGSHVSLLGPMEMGEGNVVGHAAALGHEPQIKGKDGPWGAVRIGHRNVFREYSQVQRSSRPDGFTTIGNDCYFMAGAHAAHDCSVGNDVICCNNVMLAGHVSVGDRAFLAGGAGIHQFARVGRLAIVGGNAGLNRDLPPFCMAVGDRPHDLEGLNLVGLRRAGISGDRLVALKNAFRVLFRTQLPLEERLAAVAQTTPDVEHLVAFVRESKRGVIGVGGKHGS